MKREKILPFIKWTLYVVLLVLAYSLQTTPRLFQILGVKPVLILPLVICVSMYEGVMSGAVYAMLAGLLWDISSDKLFGFNAIILICCSVLISLICIYYLRTKLVNAFFFCAFSALLQGFLDYLFYFAIWDYSNTTVILLQDILPTIGYTLLILPIFYFLIRFIANKFNDTARV